MPIVAAYRNNNRSPVACNLLHEIVNTRKGGITFRAWFFRASRCTLQYGITRPVACNLLHEKHTQKPPHFIPYRGEIFRASRCTLRSAKGALNRQALIIHRGGGWRFLIMLLLRLWVCVCLVPSLVTCGRKFP